MLTNWKYLILAMMLLMVAGCGDSSTSATQATLVSIALNPTNPGTPVGVAEQFTATGTYSDSTTKDLTSSVTWDSSDKTVATVGAYGLAAPVAAGTTTITASLGGAKPGTTNLTVTSARLVSIVVGPANPSIPIGLTEQLTATGIYSDGSGHGLTNSVTWDSSNNSFATCDAAGRVTAFAVGTPTIRATLNGITGSTTVTVTPATLASIAVSPAQPSIAIGFTQQFTAIGTYSDASTHDLTTLVTWSSSNTSVAAFSTPDLATAVAPGSTTITASMAVNQPVPGTISGSTTLTVSNATLSAIIVTPLNSSAGLGIPVPLQFTATGIFSDSTTKDLTNAVTWYSSDATIAAVSNASGSRGMVTPVSVGSVTITATMVVFQPIPGTISGSAAFTVVSPDELESIVISPINPIILVGDPLQFTATGTNADGTRSDLTAFVTWSSSDTSIADIGNIGANGKVTSYAAGSTTITATLVDFEVSTTLTVNAFTPPNPVNGAALYATYCAVCHVHGPLATSTIRGVPAYQIQEAIASGGGGMSSLSFLTSAQIRDIAAALATGP